jgi:Uma2 family endonuclease
VVQPDLLVYCDRSKIMRRGGRGAPDLVIEILSPRSAKKDFGDKFELYERRDVREYWIADPATRAIHAWSLGPEGGYGEEVIVEAPEAPASASRASSVLPGFSVDAARLFEDLD